MKLEVPFYTQGHNECGPVSLLMVLEFFGKKENKEKIKELVNSDSGGNTWSLGLANASAKLGFKTEFYSKTLGFNPELFELEYYKKESDGKDKAKEKMNFLKAECIKNGVKLIEKSLTNEEVFDLVNDGCIPIVLLDWSKINNTEKFQGHFLPIVGYDEDNVYLHQPGPKDAKAFFEVDREIFEEARKAEGTDEDLIVIYRH